MKRKILYICLSASIFINALLVIHIINMKPSCEHIHYSDIDRTKDIVPDEETARRIAETVLRMRKYAFRLKEEHTYYTEITYNEAGHEWIVNFSLNAPGEYRFLDGGIIVGVRRDNGVVLHYGRNLENIGIYNDL